MKRVSIGGVATCAFLGLLMIAVPPAGASGWDYDLAMYLFALGMDGRTVVRGREAAVDVSFSDILDDLEMAAAGHFEAAKRDSRWGWFGDVFYSSSGRNFEQDLGEYDLDMIYLEGAATYRFGEGLQALAGLRYIDIDMTLDLRPPAQPPIDPPPGAVRVQGDQSWTDLMIGGRYRATFGERWGFSARGDLAGFGISDSSDLTWNVVLLGRFQVASRVGLMLGYRWLDIDYENADDQFVFDVRQAGPVFALNYSFY
jgi:hypothetical protein